MSIYLNGVSQTLDTIYELNERLLGEIDEEDAALNKREAVARRELDACLIKRQANDTRRAAVKEAEYAYRRAFSSPNGSPAPDDDTQAEHTNSSGQVARPLRARIGRQRFLMFDAIAVLEGLDAESLATCTRLSSRRVRDQMASDVRLGMVKLIGENYHLTSTGQDLLQRFKNYKAVNHQPLPTRDGPTSADEEFDDDSIDADENPVGIDITDQYISVGIAR